MTSVSVIPREESDGSFTLIVIVGFVAVVALSIWARTQDDGPLGRGRELKPPGEPGDTDRPDGVIYP